MLTPDVDHLFDHGFITFDARGRLHFAPSVHRDSLFRMGIDPDRTWDVGGFSARQREYLEFHGDLVFLGVREGCPPARAGVSELLVNSQAYASSGCAASA